MLLTLTTTHRPATDLGYLLHKHPDRVQQFKQPFGTATVFYPETTDERCTVALVLEVDQVRLARTLGRRAADFSLAQYVNDRSYAASSLLAVAMADVFSTARSGRCDPRQQLADSKIPVTVRIPALPCRGGPEIAHRIFEPLGWQVTAEPVPLDDHFPEWGASRYLRLGLEGDVRLADALNQLYVLLPVLDESKHYWQGPDEVDKLIHNGSGWLADHPDRTLITERYLGRRSGLAQVALARLAELDDDQEDALATTSDEEPGQEIERIQPLNEQRHQAVLEILQELGARSVIDLGCGSGQFLTKLVAERSFERVAGTDVSVRSLQIANRRLRLDQLSERQTERITLFAAALTYSDDRFAGYDAAVLMEVIEHIDPPRLAALERVVFVGARPGAVIITTPNADFNANYDGLTGLRHPDHRFEWSRTEFAGWADGVAERNGYQVSFRSIGEIDTEHGAPTQLAVFRRD